MSGLKRYTEKMLISDVFSVNAAAKYDNVPEPSMAEEILTLEENETMDNYHYVADSNGSIKWIFPIESNYPLFLSLYNSPTLRAALYKKFVRLAFKLGLKKLVVSGTLKLDAKQTKPLKNILKKINHDDFAIYTGKTSERRKSVIALGKNTETTHFVKLAHSKQAEEEIKNEELALTILDQNRFKHLVHSKVMHMYEASSLIINNVKPQKGKSHIFLGEPHFKMLVELYKKFYHEFSIEELPFYQCIRENLQIIEQRISQPHSTLHPLISQVFTKLRKILEKTSLDTHAKVSLSHNDFTPWNMYLSQNKLYVYDWDLAQQQMPVLHDLFHFVYQSGIFIQKISAPKIHLQIIQALETSPMKVFIDKYQVNTTFHHQLYLLYRVSQDLKRYLTNTEAVPSQFRLINVWNNALVHAQV